VDFLFHNCCSICFFNRIDTNLSAVLVRSFEFNLAIDESKNGVISTDTDILSRMDFRTPLPHQNIPCSYYLTAELFDAESLGLAISTQPATTTCFLVCHFKLPLISYNLVDREPRMSLAMASFSTITGFGLVFKYGHLLISTLTDNRSFNLSSVEHRLAHLRFLTIDNQKNLIQLDNRALIPRELFHIDNLAW